ncbi:MAG TPA: AtpZ/AtpI family protein [Candidatus Dormibacteraeota bacterium]
MTTAGTGGPGGSELVSLGASILGAFLVPLVAGIALDSALRTRPVFLLVGLSLGIVAAGATFYVRIRRYL